MKKNNTGPRNPQGENISPKGLDPTGNMITKTDAAAKGWMRQWLPFVLISLAFVFVFYIFNRLTPLISDDYLFCYVYQGRDVTADAKPLEHFREIPPVLRILYMQYSGRIWPSVLIQAFILTGKWLFDILNSLMLVVLGWLIYFHVNYEKKANLFLFSLSLLLVWFMPSLAEVGLWMSTSLCYLWPAAYILTFLLPFRMALLDRSKVRDTVANTLLFAGLGFFAGSFNENVCFAVLAALLVVLLNNYRANRHIPRWQIAGFLSTIAGTAFMFLAPGNWVRTEEDIGFTMSGYIQMVIRNPVMMLRKSLAEIGGMLSVALLVIFMLLVLAVLSILYYRILKKTEKSKRRRKKEKNEAWKPIVFYGVAYLSSLMLMLISPSIAWRMFLFPYLTYAITVILLLRTILETEQVFKNNKKKKKNSEPDKRIHFTKQKMGLLLVCCLCLLSLDIFKEYQIAKFNSAQVNRIYIDIQKQVQAGVRDLDLTDEFLGPCYANGHLKSVWYIDSYLTAFEDPNDRGNEWLALYCGLDTVVRTGDFSYEKWSFFKKVIQ